MDTDTATIRHFITRYFDDNELNYLCTDYFREVYEDFSLGISKRQKVHNLVEYCYRHGRLSDLLAALKRERPALHQEHFAVQARPRVEWPETDYTEVTADIDRYIIHEYEVTIVIQPQLTDEAQEQLIAQVSNWLTESREEVDKPVANRQGQRRLPYLFKTLGKAIMCYMKQSWTQAELPK